jgi:hypothetical protein
MFAPPDFKEICRAGGTSNRQKKQKSLERNYSSKFEQLTDIK